jgi:hypothetical protein
MDERRTRLLGYLGGADHVVRGIIDLGPAALDDLDAIAADATQPRELRLKASRIGHEIRDRAMRAPAAPPLPTPAPVALGDGFHCRYQLEEFVARLHTAGAVSVLLDGDTLVATLPHDPAARARLFAIYNAEVDELGEEFGGEAPAGHEMTAEEAAEVGAEVGEWVVDDFHARDAGQEHLRFWWD